MRGLAIVSICLVLQACSWGSGGNKPSFSGGYSNDGPGRLPRAEEQQDAKPKWEPRTRAGNAPHYQVLGKKYQTLKTAANYRRRGTASWYGRKFHGKKTANGERYDMYSMSAAHKSLPIPSYVQVRNLSNGRSAIVRVNDRGPFIDSREIDLSYAAAVKLGVFDTGTAPVEVIGIEVARNGRIISGPGLNPPPTLAAAKPVTAPAATQTPVSTAPTFEASAADMPLDRLADKPAVTAKPPNEISLLPQWWVQAGAFQVPASAESLSASLSAQGFPNQIINEKAALAYKVRIGPFQMETHARWAQLSLKEKGLGQGFVVQAKQP